MSQTNARLLLRISLARYPAPEDWEALLATLRRNLGRSKVYPEDLRAVERLRREADG